MLTDLSPSCALNPPELNFFCLLSWHSFQGISHFPNLIPIILCTPHIHTPFYTFFSLIVFHYFLWNSQLILKIISHIHPLFYCLICSFYLMKTWLSPKDSGFPENLSDDGWFSCHNLSLIKLELGVCAFYFSSLPLSNHCILPPPPTFLIWFSYHLVVPSNIPYCNCYPCIPRPKLLVVWI